MNKITIAITTYNREKQLRRMLSSIKELINIDTYVSNIIVIDNSSNYDIESLILDFDLDVLLIRNKHNIGSAINIVMPLLHVASGWLWTLSDDDQVYPNALNIIHSDLISREKMVWIKYSHSNLTLIDMNHTARNAEEYLNLSAKFGSGNTIFISTNVYNLDLIRTEIVNGFKFSYTQVGFVLPALLSLLKGIGSVKFSCQSIVKYESPLDEGYDFSDIALGMSSLLHIPFTTDKKINVRIVRSLVSIRAHWFVRDSLRKNSVSKHYILLYHQLYRHIETPFVKFVYLITPVLIIVKNKFGLTKSCSDQ
jgi:glycosyltransferase involved in cell wall biosynthesis